jgi:hypothetical protein
MSVEGIRICFFDHFEVAGALDLVPQFCLTCHQPTVTATSEGAAATAVAAVTISRID